MSRRSRHAVSRAARPRSSSIRQRRRGSRERIPAGLLRDGVLTTAGFDWLESKKEKGEGRIIRFANKWWLGTARGLYRFPRTHHLAELARTPPDAHYARLPGLPSDDLFPLFEDTRGDIWLIAQLPNHSRLVRWCRETDSFQVNGAPEGLGSITLRPAISRRAIVEGPAGELFFGFREAGLFAYREGRFEAIRDRGEPLDVIGLHLDRPGRLWIVQVDPSRRVSACATNIGSRARERIGARQPHSGGSTTARCRRARIGSWSVP